MPVSKQELIQKVAETTKNTQKLVKEIVEELFQEIENSVVRGEVVQLKGFLTIQKKATKARVARNPITGASIKVPAKNRIAVKIGKPLKDAVNK